MLLFGFSLNYAITSVNLLMSEQYPTAIRNTGVAWCQAFARFGGSASSIVLGGIAGMAAFQTIGGTTNWSLVVLVLIVPFVLGFICALLFVRDTNGKSMDQLANEATGDELSGTAPFTIMLAIVVILFSLCIVCPLAIRDGPNSPLPCRLWPPVCSSPLPSSSSLAENSWQKMREGSKRDSWNRKTNRAEAQSIFGLRSGFVRFNRTRPPLTPPLQIVESSQRTAAFF